MGAPILLLLASALAPRPGPAPGPGARPAFARAFTAWGRCTRDTALAWAPQREAAEAIGRAAVAHCAPLLPAVRRALIADFEAGGMGGNLAGQLSDAQIARSEADLAERAAAAVMERRARAR